MAKGTQAADTSTALAAAARDTANVFGGIVSQLQSIASMGGQPAAAVASIGSKIGGLVSMAGPWGAAAGAFISVGSQLPQLFKSAADSVSSYVTAFAPLAGKQYNRAWADLTASIGQMLMPVLSAATKVVRFFGDAIAGLRPVVQPVIDVLTEIYSNFYGAFGDVLRELENAFVTLGSALMPLVTEAIRILYTPMTWFADQLRKLSVWIRENAQALALWLGIDFKETKNASQGKAAAATSTTDTASLLRRMREQAFALGANGQPAKTDAAKTVSVLEKIYTWLTETLPKELIRIGGVVWKSLQDSWEGLAKGINKFIQMILKVFHVKPDGGQVSDAAAMAMRLALPGGVAAGMFGGT